MDELLAFVKEALETLKMKSEDPDEIVEATEKLGAVAQQLALKRELKMRMEDKFRLLRQNKQQGLDTKVPPPPLFPSVLNGHVLSLPPY